MALSLEETNKRIRNPERGISVRDQNKQLVKKTAKTVKEYAGKKGTSLARGAARVAAPIAAAGVAQSTVDRQASLSPEEIQQRGGADVSAGLSTVESVAGGIEDLVNTATYPIRAPFDIPAGRPLTAAIPKVRAAANVGGAQFQNLMSGRGIDTDQAVRSYQSELAKYRAEGDQASPAASMRNLGVPIPEVTATPEEEQAQQPSLRAEQRGLPGAPQAVAEEDFMGTGLTKEEGYQPDGGYRRTLRNQQGDVVGTMDTPRRKTTDSPEKVDELMQEVSRRSIARGQASIDARQQADPRYQTAQKIKQLEEQIAQPGRGLRQSFGEMMQERQVRTAAKTQLKELYDQQRAQTQQTGQTQRAGLVSADKARDRSLRYQELVGKRGDAARKERRSLFNQATKDYVAEAKAREMKPKEAAFYVASMQETHLPGSSWDTTYGRVVRKDAIQTLNTMANEERGFFDWLGGLFGGSKPRTEADFQKMDFSGWSTGDAGEIIPPDEIIGNTAIRNEDGNYAYVDDLPSEVAWFIGQQIIKDNPKQHTNVRQTIRKGQ